MPSARPDDVSSGVLLYQRFPEDRAQLVTRCEHMRRYYSPICMCRIAEAMGCCLRLWSSGLPVMASDHSGADDLVTVGKEGFLSSGARYRSADRSNLVVLPTSGRDASYGEQHGGKSKVSSQ